MVMVAPPHDWMTPEETAAWLRVSRKTVERAIKKHRLPAFQVELTWRIWSPDLVACARAYVEQQSLAGEPPVSLLCNNTTDPAPAPTESEVQS